MPSERTRTRLPHHLLAYALSLPERLLRCLVSLLGGLVRSLTWIVPRPLRETRFFKTAVERQLRMMTDVVGRAELYKNEEEVLDTRTTMRIGVGGALDNLMILGLHASPIWLLLAATDVCQGAKAFTRELGAELKAAGFMKEGSRLDSVDDVIEGIGKLTGRLATTLDKPPLSLDDMKTAVSGIRKEIGNVADVAVHQAARIDDLAGDLRELAHKGRRSILEVTSAVAVGAVEKTGNLVAGTAWGAAATVRILSERLWSDVVMDYASAVRRIHRLGYYGSLLRMVRPQSRSLRRLFAYDFLSWTEIALSLGFWRKAAWVIPKK